MRSRPSFRSLLWTTSALVAGVVVLELVATGPSTRVASTVDAGSAPPPPPADPPRALVAPVERDGPRNTAARRTSAESRALAPRDDDATLFTLDVLVLDGDDQPLPGASVYLAPLAEPLNHAGWTDALGRLRMQWVARRETMRVAIAAGHAQIGSSALRVVELTARPCSTAIELRSKRDSVAFSSWEEDELAPPAVASSELAGNAWAACDRRRARLDEHGLLRFADDVARVPGEVLDAPEGWSLPVEPAATTSDFEGDAMTLVKGVVRLPDGTPVAQARVRASAATPTDGRAFAVSTRSFNDGSFGLGPVPARGVHVSIGGGDQGRYETDLWSTPAPACTLHPALQRGRTLVGRWSDADGRPLAGWKVELNDACGAHGPGAAQAWSDVAWTDARGRFEVANAPKTMLALDAFAPGAEGSIPFASERGRWAGSEHELHARDAIGDEAHIALELVDAKGRAVEDAEVRIVQELGDRGARVAYDERRLTYESEALPPGRYRVWAHASGERTIAWPGSIELVAGEELDLGALRFDRMERLAVEPANALGIVEYAIERRAEGLDVLVASFRARGPWTMELPPGSYRLVARASGTESAHEFDLSGGRTRFVRVGGR